MPRTTCQHLQKRDRQENNSPGISHRPEVALLFLLVLLMAEVGASMSFQSFIACVRTSTREQVAEGDPILPRVHDHPLSFWVPARLHDIDERCAGNHLPLSWSPAQVTPSRCGPSILCHLSADIPQGSCTGASLTSV